jgi:hypothetical protein
VFLDHIVQRGHARQCALDPDFHQVVGQQATAAAAAERPFVNRVVRHVVEIVRHRLDQFARNRELPARLGAHARRSRHVARVVIGHHQIIVGGRVDLDLA